uniref:Protein CUSTOS n=1 Tax=Malurus cyaneus samueli TaxID=2593467 RepID=A0A8C5U0M5_9PASS
MAAPRGGLGPDSDTGSGSDSGAEADARFREAAWDCTAQAAAAVDQLLLASKEIIIVLISNGREVNGREEGDNELQTTPEFRAHVAKKLGAILDRRRRPVSSSDTDSDQEWQRCQEAAVSAMDILKQSAFPALSQGCSQDQSQGCVEHNQKKKKKKKIRRESNVQEKIKDPTECEQICKDLPLLVSANGQQKRQDSNHRENSVLPGAVKKKKKKKKKEL